jgi:hypothetical protein
MSAVPARAGALKPFQEVFLNQDLDQLCLPVQARYKDDIPLSLFSAQRPQRPIWKTQMIIAYFENGSRLSSGPRES